MLLNRLTSHWAVACWFAVTLGTILTFWNYELTAGQRSSYSHRWPEDMDLLQASDRRQLLMFIHPQCRCTTAGLNELCELLKDVPPENHPAITFMLLQPDDRMSLWTDTKNEQMCQTFSAARIQHDPSGIYAKRFGVLTSGTCVLYSTDGRLLFAGGITQSRGHRGPNRGRDLLTQCLSNRPGTAQDNMPVRQNVAFGCPIFADASGPRDTGFE